MRASTDFGVKMFHVKRFRKFHRENRVSRETSDAKKVTWCKKCISKQKSTTDRRIMLPKVKNRE